MQTQQQNYNLTYSDDTLASFWHLFLVPVNWYQKLVSLSYFSGARFFWCQKPALNKACSISCHKPAGKLNCDWSVQADDGTVCLFVNKNENSGFFGFFNNLA